MSRRSGNQQPMVRAGQVVADVGVTDPALLPAEEIERRQNLQASVQDDAAEVVEAQAQTDADALEQARQTADEEQQAVAAEMFTLSGSDLEKIVEERVAQAMQTAANAAAQTVNPSPAAVSQAVTEEMQHAGQPLGVPQAFRVATEVVRRRETAPNGTVTEVYEGGKRTGVVMANGETPPVPRVIDADGDGVSD